jgi:hypothetical protein
MRTAKAGTFGRPRFLGQIGARLVIGLVLALALPAAAAAHGSHPAQGGFPAAPGEPAAEDSGGGTSGLLIGGVVVGMVALVAGLIYVKERQRRPASSAGSAATAGVKVNDAEGKRRARSSW